MKVLVTGATGFLGSHLVRALLDKNHQVVALKRSFSQTSRLQSFLHKIQIYDLDRCSLDEPFQGEEAVDAVIHTATCYGRRGENISTVAMTNTFFPLQLLEIAAGHGCKVFMNTDSSLTRYINSYALSKAHFVEWGRFFVDLKKILFINIVLEHFYGAEDDDSKFVTWVIRSCLQNVPELDLTAGEQRRDFIYIDDVVQAYILLLHEASEPDPKWFQEYALGSGQSVSIREIVRLIHKMCRSKTRLCFGSLPCRSNEMFESKADITLLRSLGWSPKFSLPEGLKLTISRENKLHW